jgi:nitroreductase
MNQVIQTIMDRRSIREYTEEQLSQEQLQTLLQCAINAPSGRNAQPWHFAVLQDAATIHKLEQEFLNHQAQQGTPKPENYRVLFGAPTVIFVSYDPNSKWAAFDCALATENICLAAHSMGLGSCIVGMIRRLLDDPRYEHLLKMTGTPEGYKLAFAISLGIPEGEPPEARPRDPGKIRFL